MTPPAVFLLGLFAACVGAVLFVVGLVNLDFGSIAAGLAVSVAGATLAKSMLNTNF